MLQEAAMTAARGPTISAQLRGSATDTLIKNRFIELAVDPSFVGTRLSRIRSDMEMVTRDPKLGALFPWHDHRAEAYGSKYIQEAGLKHETRDEENKYVFQYIPDAYRNGSNTSVDRTTCDPFLSALRDLDQRAYQISIVIAKKLDMSRHKHLYRGSMLDRVLGGRSVTRVLRYLPVGHDKGDAHPHLDRSLWSIHWGSTHEGLRLFMPDGTHVPTHELDPRYVAVFLGRKFAAAARDSTYGCPHGVRSTRAAGEDRYAVVTFFHPLVIDGDVEWLLANDDVMKTFERSFAL